MEQDELIVVVESLYYKEIKQYLTGLKIKNIIRIYPEKLIAEEFIALHGKEAIEERIRAVMNICEDEESKKVFQYLTDAWWKEDCEDDYFERVYSKNQYFDSNVIHFSQDEVLVDVGAYIGDSAENFLVVCQGKYEKNAFI